MRRFLVFSVLAIMVLASTGAFVASPFVAAWRLREAIRTADTATIERMVDWPRLRDSLKSALNRSAPLRKEAETGGAEVNPTLWQRVKIAFGATMVDRFVESYVTPQGLPRLFQVRKTWNDTVRGDDEAKLSWSERARQFYARVRRAEFKSFSTVEIEVADKFTPGRHVIATLELADLEWRLVGIAFKDAGTVAGDAKLLPAP